MQNIDEVIELYLKMTTNYALMITGEWGSGKTFYYKNVLNEMISNTSLPKDKTKKYKPVLVSLFGLKSIDEIQTEILLNLIPLAKNKYIKLGTSIGNSLIKGLLQLKGLDGFYKTFSETNVDKKDWINFENLVICFDDLERISKNLKLEELIGFINSLVENENIKVLIIANEGKINDKSFFYLKEKTIGNTIEFIPNLADSFDGIVSSLFKHNKLYKEFLETNKHLIIQSFEKNTTNLRILSFALSYYEKIFNSVNDTIINELSLVPKKQEILINTIKFTIYVSIEYKNGKISFKDRQDLDRSLKLTLTEIFAEQAFGQTKSEKLPKTYLQDFNTKYYKDDHFIFYPSIYDFITGAKVFETDSLFASLKKIYRIENGEIPYHYQVFNQLDTRKSFSLSNKEYLSLTRDLLKYSDLGSYKIEEYPTIFYFVSRYNNPLKLNLKVLEARIIKGMKKGQDRYRYLSCKLPQK